MTAASLSSKNNRVVNQVKDDTPQYKPPERSAPRGGSDTPIVGYSSKKKYTPVVVKSLWDEEDNSGASENVTSEPVVEPVVAVQETKPVAVNIPKTFEQPASNDPPVIQYSGRKKYQPAQVGSLW